MTLIQQLTVDSLRQHQWTTEIETKPNMHTSHTHSSSLSLVHVNVGCWRIIPNELTKSRKQAIASIDNSKIVFCFLLKRDSSISSFFFIENRK